MIKKVDIKDIPGRVTRYNSMVTADIREFMNSEWEVAEVATEKYKSTDSAFTTYRNAIQRMDAGEMVVASQREGRLFLIKKQ